MGALRNGIALLYVIWRIVLLYVILGKRTIPITVVLRKKSDLLWYLEEENRMHLR